MLTLPVDADADADARPAAAATADARASGRGDRAAKRLIRFASSQRRHRPAHRDGAKVLAGTLATFGLSSAFEFQERLAVLAARLERWQVDELPITLVALSLGLAWYAWRRRGETAQLLRHNRELAQGLIDLQERERRELARELHDELAQHCTAIRVEAAYLQGCDDAAQMAAAARRTADSAGLLQHGVRRLLRRLRPAELDELGLAAALESLAATWARRSGVRCAVTIEGRADRIDDAVATAVYRVVQEAMANVMRHAAAASVEVRVQVDAGGLTARVADDGAGFDRARVTRGLGLLGAHERAASVGGRLAVDSAPGRGTVLTLQIPHATGSAAAR